MQEPTIISGKYAEAKLYATLVEESGYHPATHPAIIAEMHPKLVNKSDTKSKRKIQVTHPLPKGRGLPEAAYDNQQKNTS